MSGNKLHIHIADDDPHSISLITRTIKNTGLPCSITSSADGEELVNAIRAFELANNLPNLMVIDMNMPRKDGLTALLELKAEEKLRAIPSIIMTGEITKDLEDQIKDTGVATLIKKDAFIKLCPTLMKNLKEKS